MTISFTQQHPRSRQSTDLGQLQSSKIEQCLRSSPLLDPELSFTERSFSGGFSRSCIRMWMRKLSAKGSAFERPLDAGVSPDACPIFELTKISLNQTAPPPGIFTTHITVCSIWCLAVRHRRWHIPRDRSGSRDIVLCNRTLNGKLQWPAAEAFLEILYRIIYTQVRYT